MSTPEVTPTTPVPTAFETRTFSASRAIAIIEAGQFVFRHTFPARYSERMGVPEEDAAAALDYSIRQSASASLAREAREMLSDPVHVGTDTDRVIDVDQYETSLVILTRKDAEELVEVLKAYEPLAGGCVHQVSAPPFSPIETS